MEGVVARGGDRGVEGVEVPAHRIGGLQLDDAGGALANRWRVLVAMRQQLATRRDGGDRGAQRRDLHPLIARQVPQATDGRLPHLRPLPQGDEHIGAPRLEPELGLGLGARQELRAVEEHDRTDAVGAAAQRDRRAAVLGLGQLARLEHRVEGAGAAQRHAARARLPQRPPAPDRDARGRQGPEQRLVGVGAVEDDHGRLGLGDHRAQAGAQAPRPAVVVAGARGRVRGHVLDRKAHLPDHRGRRREREEERLDLGAEPARDRHRAGQVAEPGPVGGGEEDPQASARSRSYERRSTGAQ